MTDKYASQKKHLANKKQLRVWIDTEKYEAFKQAVNDRNDSIYGLINQFVDDYLKKS